MITSIVGTNYIKLLQESKFNCTAATQGAHHVILLIWAMLLPSKRRTSHPSGGYSNLHQMLSTTLHPPRSTYGAEISIQISALDLLLGRHQGQPLDHHAPLWC